MASRPSMKLSGVVLDAPDAHELAAFYRRLLGWAVEQDEPGWMKLSAPDGGPGLSFQTEKAYARPTASVATGPPAQPGVGVGCRCSWSTDRDAPATAAMNEERGQR